MRKCLPTTNIAQLLADDAVLPMSAASDTFDQLEGLLAGIAELAQNRSNPTASLTKIEQIAKCGKYLADDFSNYIDTMREKFETQHVSAILNAVQGAIMSNNTAALNQHDHAAALNRLSQQAFHIANVLKVLSMALPEDSRHDAPTKSLTLDLAELTDAVAIELSDLHLGLEVAQ